MTHGMSGGVFISYRRGDSGYAAGWLHDRLRDRLGPGRIFMDVDTLRPGDDFVAKIDEAVGACSVLLAIIGPRWAGGGEDGGGQRRIDDPDDFVRLEVEAALARDVRVVPVLVDGARILDASELPQSMATLARRQAVVLAQESFADDAERLLTSLEETLGGSAGSHSGAPRPPRARGLRRPVRRRLAVGVLGGLVVSAGLVVVLWWAMRWPSGPADAFRLVLQPTGPGVACDVTATNRGTGQSVDLTAGDKYQRRSFQLLRRDDWTWQATDERCLVKTLPGAGDAALPFTQRAFVGDSDAFSVSGRVSVEVRDLGERAWCDVALRAVVDGRLLDSGRLQALGDKVVLDPGGESPVYIGAVNCEITVSAS